ncbi:MAG: carbamate kinase [Clostridiaceae bacterium BRH_c20a]|nr:MAG: carbamate kinase [Clostridiaceae bacterium BRH_c20a]
MAKQSTIVIAIGGNAITKENQKGTLEEKLANIESSADSIIDIIAMGYRVVLTHGNGPQIGNILLRMEAAAHIVPPMPLDVCGAESQGQLGYLIQRTLTNKIRQRGLDKEVVTILTQVLVDSNDPAFKDPTKPIGPFYSEEQANKLKLEKNAVFVEDSGRGYRRVVPSPKPIGIIENHVIKDLVEQGKIVITAGGGGIPVITDGKGELRGIEAVIDKDWASSVLAQEIKSDLLVIITGVEKVAINFGRPNMELLSQLTVFEAKKYYDEGHFPPGSMGPKIAAAIDYVEKTGGKALITSLEMVGAALKGEAGTFIVPDANGIFEEVI